MCIRDRYWKLGLASEGAKACLEYGFQEIALPEIVAMTPCLNSASEKLMRRIGMQKDRHNFIHPKLATDHELAEHVLYRIKKSNYLDRI